MRSHRLRSRTAQRPLRRSPTFRRAISPFGLRHRAQAGSTRAALLGSVCIGALAVLAPGAAHAVDGTWTGAPAASGPWAPTGAQPPTPCPTTWRRSPTTRRPTSVTISNSTSINTIAFDAAAPAYSFTVQNGATFTINNSSSSTSNFTVSSGATLAIGNGGFVEIGSLAGGGALHRRVRSHHPPDHRGKQQHHVLGRHRGAGSLELDDAASLTLTGRAA